MPARPRLRCLAALLGLMAPALLGGCTTWPPAGAGGAAELRAPPPAEPPSPLAARLDCSLGRFAALRSAAAGAGVLGGRVAVVEPLALRAQREYHGGLMQDAARTLDRLDAAVTAVAAELPAAARPPTGGCA